MRDLGVEHHRSVQQEHLHVLRPSGQRHAYERRAVLRGEDPAVVAHVEHVRPANAHAVQRQAPPRAGDAREDLIVVLPAALLAQVGLHQLYRLPVSQEALPVEDVDGDRLGSHESNSTRCMPEGQPSDTTSFIGR